MYDPALRELVKDALERNMIVRVVGQLDNRNELNKEGKRRSSAHIRASNIFVSERRGQIAAEVDGTSSDSSSSSDDEQTTEQQSATATGQPQAKEWDDDDDNSSPLHSRVECSNKKLKTRVELFK